jgi:hypothetical protein
VASPTVAFAVVPLIHVPPVDQLLSGVLAPTHTVPSPEIAGGAEVTVTTVVRVQEVGSVYVITVVPIETGDTTPDDEIVATAGVLPDHVPPVGEEERVVVPAGHSARIPLIAAGILFTVTSAVALHPVESV